MSSRNYIVKGQDRLSYDDDHTQKLHKSLIEQGSLQILDASKSFDLEGTHHPVEWYPEQPQPSRQRSLGQPGISQRFSEV
jgi:hypothetical protein